MFLGLAALKARTSFGTNGIFALDDSGKLLRPGMRNEGGISHECRTSLDGSGKTWNAE